MKPLRLLCVLIALLVAASPGLVSAQKRTAPAKAKKKAPPNKPSAHSSKRSSTSRTHSSKASASTKSSAKKKSVHRTTVPATQRVPEPERIREIQQALADRGYAVEVTGAWDGSSVEALKKFQNDQNIKTLSGAGKIDALTLIALGLGPAHERVAESPQPGREEQSQ